MKDATIKELMRGRLARNGNPPHIHFFMNYHLTYLPHVRTALDTFNIMQPRVPVYICVCVYGAPPPIVIYFLKFYKSLFEPNG